MLSSSPVKATMQNMILNSVLKVDTVLERVFFSKVTYSILNKKSELYKMEQMWPMINSAFPIAVYATSLSIEKLSQLRTKVNIYLQVTAHIS